LTTTTSNVSLNLLQNTLTSSTHPN
jgi:hypothetical protein